MTAEVRLVDADELRRRIDGAIAGKTEMVEAVARAIRDRSPQDTDGDFGGRLGAIRAARAVLSVPALAEVFARDAKVREIVAAFEPVPWPDALRGPAVEAMTDIAALYPEAGK